MGTSSVKRPKPTDLIRFRLAYFVEIARGSSVIVSALSSVTRAAAITEMLDDFVYWRGKEDLPFYVELLAERLEERGKPDAANEVRERVWPEPVMPATVQTVPAAQPVRRRSGLALHAA
jgi:hypothetical protein